MTEIATIREAIEEMASSHAEAVFLLSPEDGRSVSYAELRGELVSLSKMLMKSGLERGDKVAFLMDNGLLTTELFLGTMYGGYVVVPLNVRAGVAQLSYMLDHCDAQVVFVEEQYTELLGEALGGVRRDVRVIAAEANGPLPAFESIENSPEPAAPGADDAAMLMYSSGSTGKPKGAIHTHSSVLAHGRNSMQAHQLSASDRSLLVLPLYHINGECVTLIPTLLSGGSVVVAHRFVVSRFWDWVDDLHITWSALVPTIVSELVDWDDPGKDGRQSALARLRFFRSSSAPLSPMLQQQFLDKFDLPLLQAMGSTECGNVFSNPQPPGKNKIGSPGLPWGFEARIVDREGVDVAAGESGEVLLRGPGLMRGYYKDQEGTAAVVDSQGWLHTGDLARQDEDGYFFVVGRSKELIIKGGVNIAPRQIDEVLESHPAVLEAAAVGVPDRYFGEDAVAFVVLRPDAGGDERELLAYCETRLGHFKTPSRIHFMKELPKGPSGKVQRLRLLDPAVLEAVAATAQPQSDAAIHAHGVNAGAALEQIIASAWAEVLALPQVDPQTNFFALGGHSLLAIQCLSKLRNQLPMVLSLTDFFENPTVAEQTELVRHRLSPAKAAGAEETANWEQSLLAQYVPPPGDEVIARQDPSVPHPLSPGQQGLWFLEQLNRDIPVYNEAEAVRLTGELNVEALEAAMNVVVERREVLRSTIAVIDEVPHAVIHESWPLRFKKIDLSALPPAQREAEVDRLLTDEPRLAYRLESEPGIRVALLHLSPREHVLILMMHHLVCDWASEGIIWRELSAVYRALISEEPFALPDLPVKHGDYASWQHQKFATESFEEDLTYWAETLRGAPPLLELPADRPRPPIMSYRGDRIRWKLNRTLTEALRNTSRSESTSMFTVFAAALDTLLYRYSGSDDILLGIPLADRDLPELQAVVGYLLRVHALRTRLSAETTFRELLRQVQKATLDLYLHRAVPFDQVVQKLQPERTLSYNPVFQIMLNWRDRDQMLPFIGLEGLAIDSLMAHASTTKFDMLFMATDIGDQIWLELEFNTDIFDRDRMMRMLSHYQALLEAVADDTEIRLADVPLLTPTERHQVLYDWNNTQADFPRDKCVHQLFEEQVERTPDATAVVFEEASLTYRELNQRANQLAHYLVALGVGPQALIGVCLERSLDMVVSILGILKAGCAYVPLDPSFPQIRLSQMVEDSRMPVMLTHRDLEQQLQLRPAEIVRLDRDWSAIADSSPNSLGLPRPNSRNRAYVLYTSGSTGKPKGVEIPHAALVNFLLSMQRRPGLGAGDRLLAVTTLSFDIAGLEIYLPLIAGGCVVIASREESHDPMPLMSRMRKCGCTAMQATPATWRALIQAGWEGSPHLKVLCGGEALPRELAEELLTRCAELWNMYGPTETTIWSTVHKVNAGTGAVPIGEPIANTQLYILNAERALNPVGITGELYIGGAGLALGYLDREELTRERFVPNPFIPGTRMYRTGDLARWLADGSVECLGRVDNQVKIRGFRIELGEIEARLAEHPAVREAAVMGREDTPGDKRLVAYYTGAAENDAVSTEQLRSHLAAALPDYMVPAAFVRMETLPLTPNGKLDRKALPAPEIEAFSTRGYVAPSSVTEKALEHIWGKALLMEKVGIHDNFFEVGGNSLLLVKVQAEVCKQLNAEISIVEMFQFPTISSLAKHLSQPDAAVGRLHKAQERVRMRKEAVGRKEKMKAL